MEITVKVKGEEITCDPDKDLMIDLDNISDHLCKQGSWVTWWHALLSEKLDEQRRVNDRCERVMAQREIFVRNTLAEDAGALGLNSKVKVTEAVVTAVLVQDEEYKKAKKLMTTHKRHVDLLKSITKGVDDNTTILITLGGKQRAEVEAALRSTVRGVKNAANNNL